MVSLALLEEVAEGTSSWWSAGYRKKTHVLLYLYSSTSSICIATVLRMSSSLCVWAVHMFTVTMDLIYALRMLLCIKRGTSGINN